MLLAELVSTSKTVASTRSRKAKVAAMADLIRRMEPSEVPIGVGFLSGGARQGRVGVGYAGVFGLAVSPAESPSLTLAEVDRIIATIPSLTGQGSQAQRADLLVEMMSQATEDEQDFLRRLLVGEVRQGALEGVVVEAVAAAAGVPAATTRRALMLRADLGEVAGVALAGGVEALGRLGLEVLSPLKPMLAATAASLEEALEAPASVEWKLDGARIQVHRRGGQAMVFTRNLNDVTERMPEVVQVTHSLTVGSVILDGEAMALRDDGTPQPFQETMSRFGTEERLAEAVPLYPFFFDCLHLDGEDLIDRPLEDRLEALDRVVPPRHLIPRITTTDLIEAREFMEGALAAGQEGVMVKVLGSRYEAGRRGSAWRKVKPAHTYDLVVLAAEWGYGRRTGWLSNIHLGARDGDRFLMVGKTFKGMTDEMLRWQTERFLELEERRTASTVHLRPRQVVEVALDGVQASPRYPGGIALRFARVKRYRDDKDPSEADTLETLRALLR